MIKKILNIFLVLVATFSLTACEKTLQNPQEELVHKHQYVKGVCECGEVDESYSSEGLNFELTGDYYTVISYTGEDKKVKIADTYEGKPVKAIGDMAFQGMMTNLTEITFPSCLESIGEYAFQACTNLKELTLPENLKSIGNFAFEDCFNIKTIIYKATNLEIEMRNNIFDKVGKGLDAGTELIVSSNVEKLPDGLFYGQTYDVASNLTSVEFEANSNCKQLGYNCFFNCRGLVSIDFNENSSLESIGNSAFGNCSALKKIIIPSSVKMIDKYAFSATNVLTEMIVESAGEWEIYNVTKSAGVENLQKIAEVTVNGGDNVVEEFKRETENYNKYRWIKK